MKKIILFICIASVAFACKQKKKSDLTCATEQISLNGIKEFDARNMIKAFDNIKKTDPNPFPESVLISREELHDIVKLLTAERNDDIKNKDSTDTDKRRGITDGMRIYFACDSLATNPHTTTQIILVATKDYGSSDITDQEICFTGRLHQDNYTHCSDADLFKLNNIGGDVCKLGSKCPGALLFTPSLNPSPTDCNFPHSISRAKTEGMVQRFGKDTINTKSEWFDLCYLINLDENLKQNGIRIYFSRRDANPKAAISLKDAFVITTTIFDGKNYLDDFTCPKQYDYCNSDTSYMDGGGGAGDNGELCPDNCKP